MQMDNACRQMHYRLAVQVFSTEVPKYAPAVSLAELHSKIVMVEGRGKAKISKLDRLRAGISVDVVGLHIKMCHALLMQVL